MPRRGLRRTFGSGSRWNVGPRRLWQVVEILESRKLLCADGDDDEAQTHLPEFEAHEIGTYPVVDSHSVGSGTVSGGTVSGGTTTIAATYPLSNIPVLNSLPGAAVSLYLDFDGHYEASWGSYSNITQPAFDQDGDATTFSDAELTTMQNIWNYVAEDYAPFKVNVTTVEPASFANGTALRISIGGNGSWIGNYGGVAYVDSFTNSISNVVFVFPKNLSNGNAKYTAEASSHESGHGFGLQHQSQYDVNGNKLNEYYGGSGDGRAPIMGDSYSATRGLWWYGTSATSATTYQDDLAVIARSANGFGYRVDDYGSTAATAAPLTVNGNQVSASGVITTTSDRDEFSFRTDAGAITISVAVPTSVNDLDAKLELFDANGSLVASADPSTSFGASVSNTVAAGIYYVVVSSHGSYGDVGTYSVAGTIVVPASLLGTPTNLSAVTQSMSSIALSWTDNATSERGFRVDRSLDGSTWTTITTLAADSVNFADSGLNAGTTYQYRVSAFNDTTTSDFSNTATASTIPVAPTNLTASAVSSSRVDLAWTDVGGETSYKVQRSTDGATWTTIATTSANVTNYSDTGLSGATTYSYRVIASNSGGDSATSNVATATTTSAPTPPAAPTSLVAVAVSTRRVDLNWSDNSNNETGFQVQRSTNGGKSWSILANLGANVTSYSDTSVSRGKSYQYRLRASNSAGYSAYSNTATVSTPQADSATSSGHGHHFVASQRSDVAAIAASIAPVSPQTSSASARPADIVTGASTRGTVLTQNTSRPRQSTTSSDDASSTHTTTPATASSQRTSGSSVSSHRIASDLVFHDSAAWNDLLTLL